MSEDSTTNEWVISVDEIEILRAGKGNTTPVVASKLSDSEKTALQTNGIVEITENQITNNYLKNNDRIKAVLTGEVPLTTEMIYKEGTKDTGVVVVISGNEFVWVPVPVAIWDEDTTISSGTYTPMAKLKNDSSADYEALLYAFNGTTATIRTGGTEPTYLSTTDAGSNNTAGITQALLQTEYNSMINSVNKYGGFYVGRYELGLEGTTPVSKSASDVVITASGDNNTTQHWYGLYSKCKEMYNQNSQNITSSMIWGSQYDAMMNWMAKTGKSVGTANSNKSNTEQTTGSKSEDQINKVYDLYGCHLEWTIEAQTIAGEKRVCRGGCYEYNSSPSNYSGVGLDYPFGAYSPYSSRVTIWIKY